MEILSKEKLLYCETAISCLITLIIILHYRNRRLNSHTEKALTSVIAYISVCYILCDVGRVLVETGNYSELSSFIVFFASFVFICATATAYVWVVYSEFLTAKNLDHINKKLLLAAIPLCADTFFTLATPFTWWYYRIENGKTVPGPLYHVHFIIILMYVFIVIVRMLIRLLTDKNMTATMKDKCSHNIYFSFTLLITATIQMLLYDHPVYCVGLMMLLLVTQFSSTLRMVTADELTGINNRMQLTKFLDSKMHSYSQDKWNLNRLFLFIMDVDDFKMINDSFGHVVGDEALRTVAETLKKMSGKYNCFCSRYGGDEFVMVGELYDISSADAFAKELNMALYENNRARGNKFPLQLSIGYAQYDEDTKTITEFIDKADKMLYRIKSIRKAGR